MEMKIGFITNQTADSAVGDRANKEVISEAASVVQVYFPDEGITLAYYNDKFDLHWGDIVYVEGKHNQSRGRVMDVNRSFSINPLDYKRITGKAKTDIHGGLYAGRSYFHTFDRETLPYETVRSWFLNPAEQNQLLYGTNNDLVFPIQDLWNLSSNQTVIRQGELIYMNNQVAYISIDGIRGNAIVLDSKPYEVRFDYYNGEVANLLCNCYESRFCKHRVAAMFLLRHLTDRNLCSDGFKNQHYMGAVEKNVLFSCCLYGKNQGEIVIA